MQSIFSRRAKKTRHTMATASFDELEQTAKARGAAAGLHGVDDDFATSVSATLHFLFITQYGELGQEPNNLLKQRDTLQEELKQTYSRLYEHQKSQHEAIAYPQYRCCSNYRLWLGVGLLCGLAGLGCEIAGVQMVWRGWTMLGAFTVLLILLVQALPGWARHMRYYIDRRTVMRRAKRLEHRIQQLGKMAGKEAELRGYYEQFVTPRKQLLVSIFEYYKAAGQCTANHKHIHRLAAA
jgi:hypothetical protein